MNYFIGKRKRPTTYYISEDDDSDFELDSSSKENNDCSEIDDSDSSPEDSVKKIQDESEDESINSKKKNHSYVTWTDNVASYCPRLNFPLQINPKLTIHGINQNSTEVDVFYKFFPKSLIKQIAFYTNDRIDIDNQQKSKKKIKIAHCDADEITSILGVMLVMSFNHQPEMHDYWSGYSSLGNEMINNTIRRDRCCYLFSKMYFNSPEKPVNSSKIYYLEEVISCLKEKFQNNRTDSTYQSIDESMVKFKGRSAMKQYMPLKPISRGIKIWMRSDAKSPYVYDFNIYQGKELESPQENTLGARVVSKLLSTVKSDPQSVVVACDRFFTSVHMMDTSEFPMIGTYMQNRTNVPKFTEQTEINKKGKEKKRKLHKGEYFFMCNKNGTLATKWQDSKEVFAMSNCLPANIDTVERKNKVGEKEKYSCPQIISIYNSIMGGVDLADQMMAVYDPDRRTDKWWKRVFTKLLMAAVVNSWVAYKQFLRNPNIKLKSFLVPLAENLCKVGSISAARKAPKKGRPKEAVRNFGHHQIQKLENKQRRKCSYCYATRNKKEVKVRQICVECNVALCINCFDAYHNCS